MQPRLSIRTLFREVGRDYVKLFPALMGAALVVYVPLSLVDSTASIFSEVESDEALAIARAILVAAAGALFSLIGAVIYAGIVSVIVHRRRGIEDHAVSHALRTLPYGRLMGADVIYALLVSAALLLLIVPGLVLMTRYALIAPAIEIEGLGIRGALRRSRELIRPHFWKMLVVVVPLMFGSDVVSELAFSGATGALGEGFVGEWIGSLLGELITAPFLGLFLVLAFLRLRAIAE